MLILNIPIAFGAGFISFFAPCALALLPAYIGYVTGVSVADLKKGGLSPYIKKILLSSIFYILGFSLVFVLLGIGVSGIGTFLRRYSDIIRIIGGVVIVFLGLDFSGILRLPLFTFQRQVALPPWTKRITFLRSFFIGVIFAAIWTPCVGAILGSILALAAVTTTVKEGAGLLFSYSLGISLPLLIVSLSLASAPKYLTFIKRNIGIISKISGLVLVLLGVILLTDTYKFVNAWLFDLAFKWGYEIR